MSPPLATRLSGQRLWRGAAPVFRRFGALARRSQERVSVLSLLALTGAGSSGCLVAEAPEYGPPRKTTPVIDWQSVDPPPYQILKPIPPTQLFSIPVRSEDAGDGLVVYGYVDYLNGSYPGALFMDEWPFEPSPTSEHDLSFAWTIRGDISPECHQVTIFVTHASNYGLGVNGGPNGGVDPNDIASISWWATFDPDGDTTNLVGCPMPTNPL